MMRINTYHVRYTGTNVHGGHKTTGVNVSVPFSPELVQLATFGDYLMEKLQAACAKAAEEQKLTNVSVHTVHLLNSQDVV